MLNVSEKLEPWTIVSRLETFLFPESLFVIIALFLPSPATMPLVDFNAFR